MYVRAVPVDAKAVTRAFPELIEVKPGSIVSYVRCLHIVRPLVLRRVPLNEIWSGRTCTLVILERTCISLVANEVICHLQVEVPNTYLMPPGATVTSATEIPVETLNVVESAIFTDPPA